MDASNNGNSFNYSLPAIFGDFSSSLGSFSGFEIPAGLLPSALDWAEKRFLSNLNSSEISEYRQKVSKSLEYLRDKGGLLTFGDNGKEHAIKAETLGAFGLSPSQLRELGKVLSESYKTDSSIASLGRASLDFLGENKWYIFAIVICAAIVYGAYRFFKSKKAWLAMGITIIYNIWDDLMKKFGVNKDDSVSLQVSEENVKCVAEHCKALIPLPQEGYKETLPVVQDVNNFFKPKSKGTEVSVVEVSSRVIEDSRRTVDLAALRRFDKICRSLNVSREDLLYIMNAEFSGNVRRLISGGFI